MICGAMRVSGLMALPAVDVAAYYFSKQLGQCGQILEISKVRGKRGNTHRRRRSGERREGWKEKRESSLGDDTAKTEGVWNVSSLFQLKGGGVEVSQNEWHRKLCHGQKEWAKQWDSHHQIKVH